MNECRQNQVNGPVYRRFEGHLCAHHYLRENESKLLPLTVQCIKGYISTIDDIRDNAFTKVKEDTASAWLRDNVSDVFCIRRESTSIWYPLKTNVSNRAYRIDFCFSTKKISTQRVAMALEVDEWQHARGYCPLEEAHRTRVITHDWLSKNIPFLLIRMNPDHYVLDGAYQNGAFFKKVSVMCAEEGMNRRMSMVKENLDKFLARFGNAIYLEQEQAPGYMVKICFDGDSVEQYCTANREDGKWESVRGCPFE